MVVGAAVFFTSLAAIVALFSLKMWEERRGYPLAPNLRAKLDDFAARCKYLLMFAEALLAQLPSLLTYAAVRLVALLASSLARLMHAAAEGAHGLADLASHKHNFERRETRSNFLKQVGEYPRANGNGNGHVTETAAPVSSFAPEPEPLPDPVYEPPREQPLPPPLTSDVLWKPESVEPAKPPKSTRKTATTHKKKRHKKQTKRSADIDVIA